MTSTTSLIFITGGKVFALRKSYCIIHSVYAISTQVTVIHIHNITENLMICMLHPRGTIVTI